MTPFHKGNKATPAGTKKVSFTLTDPRAHAVTVAGSFNAWSKTLNPMKPGAKGVWSSTISLKPGRYEYRFVVNGTQWMDDPHAKERCSNNEGGQNCVVQVG